MSSHQPRGLMPHRRRIRDSRPILQKPYKLRCWQLDTPTGPAKLFTCGRPGRENSPDGCVHDELAHCWVLGLKKYCGSNLAIISLLGRKDNAKGKSEFCHYSFCGGMDTPSERKGRPTFQEWLDHHHKDLSILVREYPTFDYKDPPVHWNILDAVKAEILKLISECYTVVVMDSGGIGRTGSVCQYMHATECTPSNA